MKILEAIAAICSNAGYAAIIAAIIGAIAAIAVAVYNKHKKSPSDPPTVILIPHDTDPLSDLDVDIAGIKNIDKTDIHSSAYVHALAARMELLKNPDSEVDVFYEEEEHHD